MTITQSAITVISLIATLLASVLFVFMGCSILMNRFVPETPIPAWKVNFLGLFFFVWGLGLEVATLTLSMRFDGIW